MRLVQTNKAGKGKAQHKHFVYVDDKLGGLSSIANDHSHEVTPYQEPTDPVVDPISNIELAPGKPGGHEVLPGGKDKHTHALEELMADEPSQKLSDKDLVDKNKELYRIAMANESDAYDRGSKSEEFYMGDQWKPEDKKSLEAVDRAALTVNEVESKIDLLSGYQRQNRSDFRFLPTEGGDGRVADILNVLVKNVCDVNDWEFEETDIFEDGMITGRGNIHAYIDYTENHEGDIKLEHFPWRNVKYGPHNKKDGSDCEYVVKAKWYSKDKVIAMFPKKKALIDIDWENYAPNNKVTQLESPTDYPSPGQEPTPVAKMNEELPASDDSSLVSISKKEYLLIETEWKEYTAVPVVFDQENEFFQNATGFSDASLNKIKTIPGLDWITRVVTRIRQVTTCGGVLLRDQYLDDIDFSMIPFYAKKKGNRYWGKIEGVKDLQLETNKRHSQSVDIINKMAAYGWFYDSETFDNKQDEDKFTKQAAKPGFKIKVADSLKPPVKSEGIKFPAELAALMQEDSNKIKEIMNINLEMAGMARSSQSGVAIVEQKRQGLVGNEFLFDNLNRSKKRLGKKIVRMIKKCYSPERMIRILDSLKPQQPQQQMNADQQSAQGQPAEPTLKYSREELLDLLKNDDLLNYDVVVTESAFNPTNRLANFLIWSDLAGKGAPIPIMSLVDMSDVPDKEKLKQDIQQEMQRQQQTEQNKNQTEITKTMIAHGAKGGSPQGMSGTGGPSIK